MSARHVQDALARDAAIGDLDTALDALRALQWLVDAADDLQCPVHLAALIGLVADKFQDGMRGVGWDPPPSGAPDR